MTISNVRRHVADVLVIGAGGAGLRAAIEARSMGGNVIIICKSLLGKAHTVMAEGGIAAAMGNVDPRDDWKAHFRDTIIGGKYVNDWNMALLHAREAPDEIRLLEEWGALFDRTDDGRVSQRAFGGHTYKRLVHVGDRTGLELLRTLQDKVVAERIPVFMEYTVTKLLLRDGTIVGAAGYECESGAFTVWEAPAIILATGGAGRIYSVTSNSREGTGDGLALALEAGAELIDMEFVQFHPTGMVWPQSVRGILVTESVRGEGGRLTNAHGERFMQRYDAQHMELSTRDIVSRAIHTEVHEGRGTPHGGVFLSIAHKPSDFIKRKLPSMYAQFLDFARVDITKHPMEVFPTMHYVMGGVRVEAHGQASRVPGLFAAGECAGGLHGANRLGGNSLSDLLVFGRRAGRAACAYALGTTLRRQADTADVTAAEREIAHFFTADDDNPFMLQEDLQHMMSEHAGVYRSEEKLRAAVGKVTALRERAHNVRAFGSRRYNPSLQTAIDVKSMTLVAETIIRSALAREESRGAHARIDYPAASQAFGDANIIAELLQGEVRVSLAARAAMPGKYQAIVYENSV